MKCAFSKEVLALYVEGDLSISSAEQTRFHVNTCDECRLFCERLTETQKMLRSLRQATAGTADLASVRGEVLSRINRTKDALGWMLRIERFIVMRLHRRQYAFAAAAIVALVSISLIAQIRPHDADIVRTAAVFDSQNVLIRPKDYRDWVLLARSNAPPISGHQRKSGRTEPANVYMDPSAFRVFQSTGKFPEGTVLVWEKTDGDGSSVELQVSVKDSSRFEKSWGYFDFADSAGSLRNAALALADSNVCRVCHEERAETDHVFTQFYPALRMTRG